MINRPANRFYEFGIFRVDVTERVLYKEGREVLLTPKVFDTLVLLLENGSRVLTKKELMQKISGRIVLLKRTTWRKTSQYFARPSTLWQAKTDTSRQYPKRGYRFIADVKTDSSDEAVPTVRTSQFELRTSKHPPETMYARSGEVNIAYQVIGDGPLDLVFVMGWVSHMEYFWREPNFSRFLLRLASFSRLILFDKRGTGLSDRVPIAQLPTLEQRMDDVRAVMDAVGSERAALCGVSEGGPMCSLFAATYPEKTVALVMIGTYAKRIRDDDYPWAPTTAERQHFFQEMQEQWGGPVGLEERAPSMAADPQFREWWAAYLRMGASPGAALALTQMNAEIDVRQVLPSIRVPSLVVHRLGDMCLKVEEGRYVAEKIPGAICVD